MSRRSPLRFLVRSHSLGRYALRNSLVSDRMSHWPSYPQMSRGDQCAFEAEGTAVFCEIEADEQLRSLSCGKW